MAETHSRRKTMSGSAGGWLEHQDRDDPLGLLLVLGVGGVGRDGPLPPEGALGPFDLAGDTVRPFGAVLELDMGIGTTLAYHFGWVGAPPWEATMA